MERDGRGDYQIFKDNRKRYQWIFNKDHRTSIYENGIWENIDAIIIYSKKQYCDIKYSYKASFDDLELFIKGMRIVKRNVSKFYKTVAEDML